jgi:hypothetical protein
MFIKEIRGGYNMYMYIYNSNYQHYISVKIYIPAQHQSYIW